MGRVRRSDRRASRCCSLRARCTGRCRRTPSGPPPGCPPFRVRRGPRSALPPRPCPDRTALKDRTHQHASQVQPGSVPGCRTLSGECTGRNTGRHARGLVASVTVSASPFQPKPQGHRAAGRRHVALQRCGGGGGQAGRAGGRGRGRGRGRTWRTWWTRWATTAPTAATGRPTTGPPCASWRAPGPPWTPPSRWPSAAADCRLLLAGSPGWELSLFTFDCTPPADRPPEPRMWIELVVIVKGGLRL